MGTIVLQKKTKVEFNVVTSSSPSGLTDKVNKMINEGWETNGEMKVVVVHSQNRYRGTQLIDTLHEVEYSISMTKVTKI